MINCRLGFVNQISGFLAAAVAALILPERRCIGRRTVVSLPRPPRNYSPQRHTEHKAERMKGSNAMNRFARIPLVALLLGVLGALAVNLTRGSDWPQWRGINRDAHSKETGLLTKWPKEGPQLVWTFDKAGSGYGSPVVVGGKLYCMGCRGNDEYVFVLDDKGKELWSVKIAPVYDFEGNNWSRGPNATPTVDGDLLFALGSQGELVCVDKSGKEQWRKSMAKDFGGVVNPIGGGEGGWGYCWSPLVDGEQVICVPGG